MDYNGALLEFDTVAVAEATAALGQLLADPDFHASERRRAFLRYSCEATLAGRTDHIKAYTVALDVFGRPSTFNPATDPIVRVEARRLRVALDEYYTRYPGDASIQISMPLGGYALKFDRIDGASHCPVNSLPRKTDATTSFSISNDPTQASAIHLRIEALLLSAIGLSRRLPEAFCLGLFTGAAVAVSVLALALSTRAIE